MAYYLNIFSPETWRGFRESGSQITGVRDRYLNAAGRVNPGDLMLCYLTRLSRWSGLLEVESHVYQDTSAVHDELDEYKVRFRVKPIVVLDLESSIPIYDDDVWHSLSLTKNHQRGRSDWTGFFRGTLNEFDISDGQFLAQLLQKQDTDHKAYPFSDKDRRRLNRKRRVRTIDRLVEVEVPDDEDDEEFIESESADSADSSDTRVSTHIQAKIATMGAQMGFHVWVPRNDKTRVLELTPGTLHDRFLNVLPLNYDDTTLRTVEQIDVIWLKGRSMARAFEVEHTTAIYSGLLRMADLLALQPNMDIRLHIVAPPDKRGKVLREIRRPVFSLLDRGPLYDQCSFLSYESIEDLATTQHLSYMSDAIIREYEETAEV